MKKQNKNTLEEKEVRKEALKMMAVLIAVAVVIEVVVFILIQRIGRLAVDAIPTCIGLICLDIVVAIAAYIDFKKEVIKLRKEISQKGDKDNKTTE